MNIHFLTRVPQKRISHALVETAKKEGHNVQVLDIGLFSFSTNPTKIFYDGAPWHPVDLVYSFWAKRDTFLPLLLHVMHSQGQCLYKPLQLEIPTKLSAAVLFQQAQIPSPMTFSGSSLPGVLPIIENTPLPLILKLSSSAQGKGVFLYHEKQPLIEHIQMLCEEGTDYVIQECILPIGEDVRAFIINNQVVAAMRRKAKNGEFRANIALGGKGFPTELSQEETILVCKSCSLFGLPMAGVDFIRTPTGPVVLEVNREPGYKGISEATGKDIAKAVVLDFSRVVQQTSHA